jgi:crotonobetainyl-CoA:carnitine CoA-transferase CaiB-like acyl-CoA transferase|tara:strand:+ start:902 stop:2086 length:1185 start_codon:yes stop_codon:yes gene_type:complete
LTTGKSQNGTEAVAGPLSGLLVADLSRVLAGPYSTQMLGDLGAEIIKVESPVGDETRSWRPPQRDGVSTYYLGINRNKRDIVLDFGDAEDLELTKELVRRADIVIENFKPGGLKKFGLDYESVAKENPNVIYASISGFGSKEGAKLPGYDLIVQAASGLMSLTGSPEGEPFRSGVSVFDIMTGMQATIGILAALNHRNLTGEGQHVEVNLMLTALAAMANHSSTYIAGGEVPFRMGNSHPSLFPYEPLPAKDGDIIIVAANNTQFASLCRVLGLGQLIEDERFLDSASRNLNRKALREYLVEALSKRSIQEWFTLLTDAGVACGPINTIKQGVELATSLGLDPVIQVGDQQIPMIRNAIGLSKTPASYRLSPPSLGQHSQEIREWLQSPGGGTN